MDECCELVRRILCMIESMKENTELSSRLNVYNDQPPVFQGQAKV